MTNHEEQSTMVDRRFRVLVAGSRTWPNPQAVRTALCAVHLIHAQSLTVVHGAGPHGVDAIADRWCRQYGIAVEKFPADWPRHGRAAGLVRNVAMIATRPDLCLAFIHHHSLGATHCARTAHDAGIPTTVHRTWGGLW